MSDKAAKAIDEIEKLGIGSTIYSHKQLLAFREAIAALQSQQQRSEAELVLEIINREGACAICHRGNGEWEARLGEHPSLPINQGFGKSVAAAILAAKGA